MGSLRSKREAETAQAIALVRKVWRRVVRRYRKLFRNRNYVFVHHGPFEAPCTSSNKFVRYERYQDIPADVIDALVLQGGTAGIEADRREMQQAAVLWIAIRDGRPAAVLFTRLGRDFLRWFVRLNHDDIVIFRMKTFPEFRGHGIAPMLMRYAMSHDLGAGGAAYIDCSISNTPSIRAISKVGFTCIATMKPITRTEALG